MCAEKDFYLRNNKNSEKKREPETYFTFSFFLIKLTKEIDLIKKTTNTKHEKVKQYLIIIK